MKTFFALFALTFSISVFSQITDGHESIPFDCKSDASLFNDFDDITIEINPERTFAGEPSPVNIALASYQIGNKKYLVSSISAHGKNTKYLLTQEGEVDASFALVMNNVSQQSAKKKKKFKAILLSKELTVNHMACVLRK